MSTDQQQAAPEATQESNPNNARRRARASDTSIDYDAALERAGMADLPEVFSMRDRDGSIIQERAACFQLRADCFLGRGLHATLFEEGATVVYDDHPNQHMEPLNRAAGINFVKWLDSLPTNRTFIDIGDMSEAAHILAKDPDVTKLPPLQYQDAVVKLATELKLRREGRDARSLPDMAAHNFAPVSGGRSAPMLGAKMSDLSQLAPGMTRSLASNVGPAAGVRKAAAPLGGPPPGR